MEPTDGDVFAKAAGEPGDAAELPATTGRDPEAGTPDREVTDEDGASA